MEQAQRLRRFENLVISDKCKTAIQDIVEEAMFENLVISDKCKTIKLVRGVGK